MQDNGYSAAAIKTLWDILLPFSDYAFNKAHSAAYGVVSFWTAYLKAHYPAEYMAALLTSVGDARDKLALYLNECRRMGIKVMPPDVNESIGFFAAVGEDIRFGMGAIRNVGSTSSTTSCRPAPRRARSSRSTTSSARSRSRPRTSARSSRSSRPARSTSSATPAARSSRSTRVRSKVRSRSSVTRPTATSGFDFDSLFAEVAEEQPSAAAVSQVPDRPEWSKRDKLAFERDMLGLYVSDHPLAGLEIELAKHQSITIADLIAADDSVEGETVTVAGLLTSVQHRVAKSSGNPYGIVDIEDFGGQIGVMFLGKTYQGSARRSSRTRSWCSAGG